MYWVLKRNYIETVTGQDSEGNDVIQKDFSHWSIVAKQDKFMLPRGIDGLCVTGPEIDRDIAKVEVIDDEVLVVEDSKKKQLKDKKKEIEGSVKSELKGYFGNKNDDELNYDFLSAVVKIITPSKYVSENLKAEMDISTFVVGDKLDTATKIKNYYGAILADIDKKRMAKIKEYKDLKK